MAVGITTDVYRRSFVFLLIVLDLHMGRRRRNTDDAFPSAHIVGHITIIWHIASEILEIVHMLDVRPIDGECWHSIISNYHGLCFLGVNT